MAFIACRVKSSSGGGGGTRRWIFNDEFVNGYEDVIINSRGGNYYNTVYWGIEGRYDGKALAQYCAKTSPSFGNIDYKYLKVHIYNAYVKFGALALYIFDGNGNVLKTLTIWQIGNNNDSFSDRWYTIDLSTLGLETNTLSFGFSGQCGYDSGQCWGVKMDKIYLTNEED